MRVVVRLQVSHGIEYWNAQVIDSDGNFLLDTVRLNRDMACRAAAQELLRHMELDALDEEVTSCVA